MFSSQLFSTLLSYKLIHLNIFPTESECFYHTKQKLEYFFFGHEKSVFFFYRIYERPAQENDLTRPIGIIHRFSRLVMLLFHKWLHMRLNHKDACMKQKLEYFFFGHEKSVFFFYFSSKTAGSDCFSPLLSFI
jgi:hypothetical protein